MFQLLAWSVSASLSLATLAWLWYRQRRDAMQMWRRNGVIQPPDSEINIILGNLANLVSLSEPVLYESWFRRFATSTVGFYMGVVPCLVTQDLTLLKRIFGTDFKKFAIRPLARYRVLNTRVPEYDADILAAKSYAEWKVMRDAYQPIFTRYKLTGMDPILKDSIDRFIESSAAASASSDDVDSGGVVDFHDKADELAEDMSLKMALGVYVDFQTDRSHPLVRAVREIFGEPFQAQVLAVYCFPALLPILSWLTRAMAPLQKNYGWGLVLNFLRPIVHARMQDPDHPDHKDRRDMLHYILQRVGEGEEDKKPKLDLNTVLTTQATMVVAGIETTSKAISFCIHDLTVFTHWQDRVREEVQALAARDGELGWNVTQLPLLNAVVSETLRLYAPIISLVSRVALEEVTYPDLGFTIPRGAEVIMPIHNIHRNPQNWHEPDVFDPTRFLPPNRHDPWTWMPFGAGHMTCIGAPLALYETKLTLARLLVGHRLVACAKTDTPLIDSKFGALTVKAPNGIWSQLVPL